jgi:putative tryptophan/tyrosine transport system substrate-binding protein
MRCRARILLLTILLTVLLGPSLAEPQQAQQLPRIGYLSNSPGHSAADSAFLDGLRDLGYQHGCNMILEARYSAGQSDRFPAFAADLVRLNVQVIAAWSPTAVAAARQATSKIPIVGISMGSDPVAAGWITSMARPNGNLTGITGGDVWLNGKRLDLLKEIVPTVTRFAVLADPTNPEFANQTKEAEKMARSLKVQTDVIEVSNPAGFGKAFAEMKTRKIGALLVVPDGMFWAHRADIVKLAAENKLPTMYWTSDYTELGGLVSYAESLIDIGVRASGYVDKILRGASPRDLPVEQPTKFELVVNMKAAKSLGITIPTALQPDRLIE